VQAGSLQEWVRDLLRRLGYSEGVVSSVVLHFQFRPEGDGSDSAVRATITTISGRAYVNGVDHVASDARPRE
jgi:hypothetical protein